MRRQIGVLKKTGAELPVNLAHRIHWGVHLEPLRTRRKHPLDVGFGHGPEWWHRACNGLVHACSTLAQCGLNGVAGVARPQAMTTLQSDPSMLQERVDPLKLWYVSDRRVRTSHAATEAVRVVNWVLTGRGLEEPPGELLLFKSLHTCAFRAARRPAGKTVGPTERRIWARRWSIIRECIVEKNLGLVHLTIRRFRFQTLDEDDLLSEAMYGLGRAIDRFNPWKGFRFSTYACNVIARALLRRGKGESRYRRLFPVQHDASYEKPLESGDHRTDLCLERLRRALDRNLGELTDLEATVLSHRFPLDREPRRTFQEIGAMVGLSKERVRQIQNIALQKLRRVLVEDPVLR